MLLLHFKVSTNPISSKSNNNCNRRANSRAAVKQCLSHPECTKNWFHACSMAQLPFTLMIESIVITANIHSIKERKKPARFPLRSVPEPEGNYTQHDGGSDDSNNYDYSIQFLYIQQVLGFLALVPRWIQFTFLQLYRTELIRRIMMIMIHDSFCRIFQQILILLRRLRLKSSQLSACLP